MELLQINDVLYNYERWGSGVYKYTVTRVTPTTAILSNGDKVKRSITTDYFKNKTVSKIGGSDSYYLETEELKLKSNWTQYFLKAKAALATIKPETLTLTQLMDLIKLIDG